MRSIISLSSCGRKLDRSPALSACATFTDMAGHIIERAFQLADSGAVRRLGELRRALQKEGFINADMAYLHGASISRQLTERMKASRSRAAENAELPA